MIRSCSAYLTGRSALSISVLVGGLALVGCGSGDDKPYSQDFPKPEGASTAGKPDPYADLSRAELRQKDDEEAAKKGKGQQQKRRP